MPIPNEQIVLPIINFLLTFHTIYTFLKVGFISPKTYMSSPWPYFEIAYIATNGYICFAQQQVTLQGTVEQFRLAGSILSIVIFFKSFYFLRLIDAMAPLIDTIFAILARIVWFMVIILFTGISFAMSFYLIGKN